MTLTFISSRESTRKKFFMNSTYIMSRKWESKVFELSRAKWLLHPSVRANQRENNFFWTRRTSCLESGNQSFLGSVGRNDSNTHQFAGIGEKNFSWTRRTSCLESGNQRFLGSGRRNDSNTHQFARIGEKKLFMNSRYIVSRKWESNLFGLRRPKWHKHSSVRANQREKNFLSTRRTSCLEIGNHRLRRPKWL